MNRKLNTSLTALLACALALAAAMLVAVPAVDGRTTDAGTADAAEPVEASGNAFRRGLALPYFSFARGIRRIGG